MVLESLQLHLFGLPKYNSYFGFHKSSYLFLEHWMETKNSKENSIRILGKLFLQRSEESRIIFHSIVIKGKLNNLYLINRKRPKIAKGSFQK